MAEVANTQGLNAPTIDEAPPVDPPASDDPPPVKEGEVPKDDTPPAGEVPKTDAAPPQGITVADEDRDAWLAFKAERAKAAITPPSAPTPAAPAVTPALATPAAPGTALFKMPDLTPDDYTAAYVDLDPAKMGEIRQRDAAAVSEFVTAQMDAMRTQLVESQADTGLGMALAVDVLKQVPEIENNMWMAVQAIQDAFQANPKASVLTIQKDAIAILRKEMSVAARVEESAKQKPQTAPRTGTPGARGEHTSVQAKETSHVGRASEERLLGL
jgi:hypothetical protein